MEYVALVLYVLGVFMQFRLGENLIIERDPVKHEPKVLFLAATLWPVTAFLYILRALFVRDE